jgi:hypothetical protein
MAEEVMEVAAELVDIIPILKYVPEWFPGDKFQRLAATMQKHAALIRNVTFSATNKLMVSDASLFSYFYWIT